MAKESCGNCYVKLAEPVSFCPSCDRPTPHATDSERLEWDLKQWRTHVDRTVAAGLNPNARTVGSGAQGSVAIAPHAQPVAPRAPKPRPRIVPAPASQSRFIRLMKPSPQPEAVAAAVAAPVLAPLVVAPAPAPALAPAPAPAKTKPQPVAKKRRPERKKRWGKEPAVVLELDRDQEFAYRTCATCCETDWIVRYSRNDDETWNYWCVRCSRSFKTEVKLRQALKPFLCSGVVVGGITAASLLMLR